MTTGFNFFVAPNNTGFTVANTYVSGEQFSSGWRVADSDLTDLGLTEALLGTFEANFATSTGSQSITMTLGGTGPGPSMSPVPLPAAGWMLVAGVGGLVAMRRRKKA